MISCFAINFQTRIWQFDMEELGYFELVCSRLRVMQTWSNGSAILLFAIVESIEVSIRDDLIYVTSVWNFVIAKFKTSGVDESCLCGWLCAAMWLFCTWTICCYAFIRLILGCDAIIFHICVAVILIPIVYCCFLRYFSYMLCCFVDQFHIGCVVILFLIIYIYVCVCYVAEWVSEWSYTPLFFLYVFVNIASISFLVGLPTGLLYPVGCGYERKYVPMWGCGCGCG